MSDHQFEKNVRKQLEDLRFHPNAAVWTSVEKRIAGRKRKRRGIVWIPVLLLLTASGYWFVENRQQKDSNLTTSQNSIVPENQPSETTAHSPDPANAPAQRPNPGTSVPTLPTPQKQSETTPAAKSSTAVTAPLEKSLTNNTLTLQPQKPDVNQDRQNRSIVRKRTADGAPSSIATNKSNTLIAIRSDNKEKKVVDPLSNTTESPVITIRTDQKELKDPGSETAEATTARQNVNDAASSVPKVVTTPVQANFDSVTIAAIPPVEKRKLKWQWGIVLQGGLSNVTEGGLFDVTEKSLVQDVASNSFSLPLPANAFLPMPSDVRPAFSYGAGVFIKKPVSKRIDLSAGLHYTLLQTSIQVGQWTQMNFMVMNARGTMDVNAFYRAGTQQEYKNQYHFVEIPLHASLRLNKRMQNPLTLNTGIVIGRLLASNALHFDGASRVYYEDNSLFNKTQFGFSGGISIGLLQRTGHPVTIGPFLHYRATNLMKQGVSVERHLLSFGVDMKVLMKK